MAEFLMMSAKLATAGLLKINVFWNKNYDAMFSSMKSPSKFYHMTQIIL